MSKFVRAWTIEESCYVCKWLSKDDLGYLCTRRIENIESIGPHPWMWKCKDDFEKSLGG